MKLKISNSNPLILEDEYGNPMFQYVGIHPRDVERLIKYIEKLEDENYNLRLDLYNYDD